MPKHKLTLITVVTIILLWTAGLVGTLPALVPEIVLPTIQPAVGNASVLSCPYPPGLSSPGGPSPS